MIWGGAEGPERLTDSLSLLGTRPGAGREAGVGEATRNDQKWALLAMPFH